MRFAGTSLSDGLKLAGLCTWWFVSGLAVADDQGLVKEKPQANAAVSLEPILQPYEPITAGYTKDSDDVAFLDVTLSVKVRLLPQTWTGPRNRAYFAMTTRFGFYWGSRPGSPVIGKDYNPQLFWRFLANPEPIPNPNNGDSINHEYLEYFDFGYGHQSNGQLVHTPAQYKEELVTAPQPEFADNFIHRGWDYIGAAWKKTCAHDVAFYLDARYFMPYGLFQGREDQYHPWENNPQGKARRTVDGLDAAVEFPSSFVHFPVESPKPQVFSRPNLTLRYKTGYDVPFRYSTFRAEAGFQSFTLPLAIWVQSGYMSDLAMYYKKVTSYGIELRFETF